MYIQAAEKAVVRDGQGGTTLLGAGDQVKLAPVCTYDLPFMQRLLGGPGPYTIARVCRRSDDSGTFALYFPNGAEMRAREFMAA